MEAQNGLWDANVGIGHLLFLMLSGKAHKQNDPLWNRHSDSQTRQRLAVLLSADLVTLAWHSNSTEVSASPSSHGVLIPVIRTHTGIIVP